MDLVQAFADPGIIAGYVEETPRKVPGFSDLHRMAMLLLAERARRTANILVVGAGGGLELKAFAQAQPRWSFVGVDPSAAMLDLARQVLGPWQARIVLQQSYVDAAPPGPFDGATCLLTLHFLARDDRLRTLREIRQRLSPGAALVVAHHSYPADSDPSTWLERSVAFAGGSTAAQAHVTAAKMAEQLPLLSADEDEAILREAGFSNVALFYAGFSFRGWSARD
ncbi:class I SAM-dependent methyltransferase (plasmid) [Nitrobacteraceae bacterium UC4446_H13]